METLTFKVAPKRRGSPTRVAVGGELTIYTAAELRERMLAVLPGTPELEVSCVDVSEVDTAGLQVLLSTKLHCDQAQVPFALMKPSEPLLAALGLLGLDATLA